MSEAHFPSNWVTARVEDVGGSCLGLQRSPARHTGPTMKPYLRVANVFEGRIDVTDVKQMNFTVAEQRRFLLCAGDVLLNEGQSPEFLGRPAIWTGQSAEMYFTNSLIRFRPVPTVLSEWALLVFRHYMHSGRFRRESRITTNIAHLALRRFQSVEFPVPPLNEQHRIVEELERRLSHVDAAIAGIERSVALLDRVVAAVREAVSNGSLLGLDCSGWLQTTTGEVTEVKGGIQKQPKRRPVDHVHPFLRVANVGRGVLDLKEIHQIELFGGELQTYELRPGDLLVVEGNGSPDQIGRAAMFDGSIAGCVHQNHLIRVRPGDRLDPSFLNLVWNAPSTVQQLVSVASSTSGLHTLSTGKVKGVKLYLPPLEDQVRLVREAERRLSLVEAVRRTVSEQRAKAHVLRRSLLAAAFRGRLVPQDPSDEPADVLLAKIKASRSVKSAPTSRRRVATKEKAS